MDKCIGCNRNFKGICPNCKAKSENASIKVKKLNKILPQIQNILNSLSLISSSNDGIKNNLRKASMECQEEIKKLKKQILTEPEITNAQKWWANILQNVKKSAS